MPNRSLWLHFGLCAALGLGCNREASVPLATANGFTISADQFRASVNNQSPGDRGFYSQLDKKHELLEKMIDFEVLLAEARRQGLERSPEIVRATRELMVQQLLRGKAEQYPGGKIPSEGELRAQFEARTDREAVPQTVRALHLFLAVLPGADRPKRRLEIEALRAQALALPASEEGDRQFAALARQHSDEASTAVGGGDLTHRTHTQLESFYSRAVADGAFAVKELHQVSEVLESERGLHLFRLLERGASRLATFEEFRASQVVQVAQNVRDQDLRAYTQALRSKANVVVREEELKQLNPLSVVHQP